MKRIEGTPDLLCTGTALVDSIIRGFDPTPVSAAGYRAESGTLHVGGEAVNAAIAAAKLNGSVGILCYLGADAAGDMIESALARAGVDTSAIVHEKSHPTPVSTLFVNADGTRKSVTNGAHRFNFHPERYADALKCARAVSFGSLFRAPYNDAEVLKKTIGAAEGAILLADTKLPNFVPLTLDDIAESVKRLDYIFPNEDEARYLTGRADPDEAADVLLSYGVRNVIIKLGGNGCLFKNAYERIRLNAHRVDVVDATGAGDCFLAGFAIRILEGASHADALRFANACGAVCCTAVGATAGIGSRAQVEAVMKG